MLHMLPTSCNKQMVENNNRTRNICNYSFEQNQETTKFSKSFRLHFPIIKKILILEQRFHSTQSFSGVVVFLSEGIKLLFLSTKIDLITNPERRI